MHEARSETVATNFLRYKIKGMSVGASGLLSQNCGQYFSVPQGSALYPDRGLPPALR